MSKLIAGLIASGIALAALAAPPAAAALGPHAGDCAADSSRPAMLVRVIGLKARTGVLRVQSYGGDPRRFFEKGTYLERIEVRPPARGPVEICLPVAANGRYAVSVRHDVKGTGQIGLDDGAGLSGNPNVSLMDVIFKRKPSPAKVTIVVRGRTIVPVVMNYVQGGSVRPVASAEAAGE